MFEQYTEEEKKNNYKVLESLENEEGRAFSFHAIERVLERGLLPSIIENTIQKGEEYRLDENVNPGYDTTHLYVNRNAVDIAPPNHPKRSIGNRIIEVRFDGERTFRHLVVFTKKENEEHKVRSAYPQSQSGLENILEKQVVEEEKETVIDRSRADLNTAVIPYKYAWR